MKLLRATVAPPSVPDTVRAHAFALAREKTLMDNADRALMLRSAAAEVERYIGAAYFGDNRTAVATVDVDGLADDLAIVPTLPDSENVRLDSVELWSDSAADFEATTAYTVRPNNTIRLHSPGAYRITATVSSPAILPPEVTEAVGRIWAIRENTRPGDTDLGGDGGQLLNLAGAVLRSGAGEVLRHLRRETL